MMNEAIELELKLAFNAFDIEDYEKSFSIALPLANLGIFEAQKLIAGMYLCGKGIAQNTDQAIKWYKITAKAGDPISQNNLASLMLAESPLEAIEWYKLAAEKEIPFAEESLADIYAGFLEINPVNIVMINYRLAFELYEKAAFHGSSSAHYRLAQMYEQGLGIELNSKLALQYYQKAANEGIEEAQQKVTELLK